MKKSDVVCIFAVIIIIAPFFLIQSLFDSYWKFNQEYPYIMAFAKFFILAPFGEMLGLRIRKGVYYEKGFGLLPRAIVWGFLGISIKMAFDIFAHGTPVMLMNMGMDIPGDILLQAFSAKKLVVTFAIGISLNLFYAPVLMVTHKITDEHIKTTGGSLKGFFSPFKFGKHLANLNWKVQWEFTFKKAIPFFWIPAQSINFLLPEEYRILVAAVYSIILGVLLSLVSINSESKLD
ncbi:MAG: Mpv17/PMP22 family protein [Bacteroidetes bacterium]|nr:Mpv17/PMP22 family protein [Bacteroidota bacterium]